MNEEPRYGYKIHAFELYSTRIMLGCMKSLATAIRYTRLSCIQPE